MKLLAVLSSILALTACALPPPQTEYLPSKKTAAELRAVQTNELRAVQTKLVPGDQNTVMRAVIATLHDLGYRITKVESGAGTVSATRHTALRIAVVTGSRSPNESIVRANATVVALYREAQVDSAEFYRTNFFEPLGASMHRQLADVPDGVATPDPLRPTPERNTAKERQAAAATPVAPQPSSERKAP